MNNRYFFFATIAVLLFFAPSIAIAQNIPPGDQPGAQASRFQTSSQEEQRMVEKKKVKAPDIEVEEEKKPEAAQAAKDEPSFVLEDVVISGSTVFKPQDLAGAYETYIGKKVVFKDLEDIANNVKARYKEKGYLTTTVYIPEQNVAEGRLDITVAEGKLGQVKVEGNKWFSGSLIEKYIHIKKNEILNIFRLNRDMLRLNQNSDLEVKALISPGKEPSTTDILLKVSERFPYHIGASFDNQGTRLVGKYRTTVSFRSSNLTGLNDSLFVNTLMGGRSSGDFISYLIPIDTYGTKAGLDISYFFMRLGREYSYLDIIGETQIYTPHISGEIYVSEDFQANIDCGLDIKSIKKLTGSTKTSNDQLRMPYTAFSLSKVDTLFGGGQTVFAPRFSFSTAHFLGASSHDHLSGSRPSTGGFFFKYEQVLNRIQKMFFGSYISARTLFQAASDTLPSSEQIQIGGANSVRGYPEGDYLADIGAVLNLEWIFPCYIFPKDIKLPYADLPLRDQLQPVVFMDLGGGKIKKPASGERETKFLMGLGGGIRFRFNRNLFLRIDWAERVGDRPSPGQGPSTFYASIQSEI